MPIALPTTSKLNLARVAPMPVELPPEVSESTIRSFRSSTSVADDTAPVLVFNFFQSRKSAIVAAFAGIFGICAVFTVCICFFKWNHYEASVDVIAFCGFCVFLISGIFVHLLLLQAIKKSKMPFVTPFLFFHGFLLLMENIMVLTAVGQLVSDQDAHLSESDYLAREILLVSPGCMSMQMLMIYIGFKFREFLKRQTAFGNGFESIRPVFIFQNDVNQSLPNEIKEP